MKYIIFYEIAGTQIFANNERGSCFLTKEEAQDKIEKALGTIPKSRIHLLILKRIKHIRKGKKYFLLTPKYPKYIKLSDVFETLKLVFFPDADHVYDYEDLKKDKGLAKGKIIAEPIHRFLISVKIG